MTGGQEHDVTQAEALISGMESEYVIADRAYDSRQFRESIIGNRTTPVIPPRSNRRELPSYDKYLYRERHLGRTRLWIRGIVGAVPTINTTLGACEGLDVVWLH